ncbi:hypothetical protein [Bradyrhizobium neotropicale]|uniref:hypothetical protein n=1 Tax=Bradyrhizobium neotropicale TaxID=1497615 RepID=UPI001AD6ED48|nr:hypothetical protein [Bradyrhizobium neotropicale]MBO4228018.1 hypothetical protein [Bradyrhizobium neotropicale]
MDPKSSADNDSETKIDAPVDQELPDTNTADSSNAEGAKDDLLTRVKDALDKSKEKSPASDEPGSNSDEPPPADAKKEGEEEAGESDDLTKEDLARLKPKTRKRLDALSQQVTDRDVKIADLSPKAEKFDQIQRFVDDAGLTKDDVNTGFDVMRNLKNDPFKAYEQLRPIMDQLESIVGVRLPEDLQQGVQRGQLTEAHARELARSRSQAAVTGQQLQRTTQRQEADRQRQEIETQVDDVAKAVTEWENTAGKGDPDWKLKQPRITDLVEIEVMRRQAKNPGYFPSKEEAIEISKKALERVEAELKALRPSRRAVSTTPSADAGSTRTTAAAPKTMLEAAKIGLQRMTG